MFCWICGFLLIPLFCWVCGFWLWSMVARFLRFVGSMVRLFFFFFLFPLFVFLRKSLFFNFFFFFSESEKGKRETFGVAGFGVVRFDGGANSLGMKREMKMKKRSSNGNNSAYSRCDNALAKGPTTSSNLPTCHWNSFFEFWKQVKLVFSFGHSNPFSWETEWWKRWFKTNQTNAEFWKQVGHTRFGWWKQKTKWYHSKLSSSKQALNNLAFNASCFRSFKFS